MRGQHVRIFYWLCDSQGVGHYRALAPAAAIRDAGHHVTCSERIPDEAHDGAFDVIVGMRVCNEGASRTWQRLATAGHTKLVFEIDDDLWHVDPSNRPAAAFYRDDVLKRLTRNVEVADAVTVSTEPLADVLRTMNRNVHVVPNQIPAWLLNHDRPATDTLTVGWRGGSSHSRDFGELARPLRSWLQHPTQRGRVGFHSMGADYTARVTTRHTTTRHTPWMPSVGDFLRAIDFDAALIPLRPSVFNDSKSELALLEMSALGIPSIVSDTGPYARAIHAGCPALGATDAHAWRDLLGELFDPVYGEDLRAQWGKQARDWARTRTFDLNVHRWVEAYES
ncbi:hypothetical protein AB0383_20450 [Amycolatopsis sp. NPDC051373]|uniref:hypothetical protein n=1 Tax=Amycolatopsis sp. NPDC051373 TaxID=3155801 RepID=UPI00344CA0F2